MQLLLRQRRDQVRSIRLSLRGCMLRRACAECLGDGNQQVSRFERLDQEVDCAAVECGDHVLGQALPAHQYHRSHIAPLQLPLQSQTVRPGHPQVAKQAAWPRERRFGRVQRVQVVACRRKGFDRITFEMQPRRQRRQHLGVIIDQDHAAACISASDALVVYRHDATCAGPCRCLWCHQFRRRHWREGCAAGRPQQPRLRLVRWPGSRCRDVGGRSSSRSPDPDPGRRAWW